MLDNATVQFDLSTKTLCFEGDWSLTGIEMLESQFSALQWPSHTRLSLNCQKIDKMDSAGAWLMYKCIQVVKAKKNNIKEHTGHRAHKQLLELVARTAQGQNMSVETKKKYSLFAVIGYETHQKWLQCCSFFALIGELIIRFMTACTEWRRFEFSSIMRNIEITGFQAFPIVGLLSFLIGVVLTYQMGLQLQTYGANVFIVYLTGMAIQREFAPLITAIIVAGRTSSSFTAQLGSMKVNEELDAVRTMGLSSVELLVMPKVIGLFFAFPLLIFWADLFATFGSMVMSKLMLNINYFDFVIRLKESLGVEQYLLGLVKAPVFALIIALVGCHQGFRVQDSATSVGLQTTKSVVQAIFLIIIADAIFSLIYTWVGI